MRALFIALWEHDVARPWLIGLVAAAVVVLLCVRSSE